MELPAPLASRVLEVAEVREVATRYSHVTAGGAISPSDAVLLLLLLLLF